MCARHAERVVDAGAHHRHRRVCREVARRRRDGSRVGLHRDDLARLPHPLGQRRGEEADAGIQVQSGLARLGGEHGGHGVDEGRCRPWVDLPETARRHLEGAREALCCNAFGEDGSVRLTRGDGDHDSLAPGRCCDVHGRLAGPVVGQHTGRDDAWIRDETRVDGDDLVRPTPPEAGAARLVDGELDPGAPAQAVGVAGQLLDGQVDVELGQPRELLADDRGLEVALVAKVRVLEVAAAAQARRRIGAGRGDPVRAGLEHHDAVGAHEPVALARLGDLRVDALTRQRMADKDDAPLVPRHTEATVRDGAHVEDHHVADGEGRGGRRRRAHWPSRTEPAVGPSKRSSAPCDDASCHGTLATMTPGVKSRRPLSRRALWLCSTCSYHLPRTYSGM